MNLFVTSLILLLITVVQEQINADIGRCACDLNKGICDVSCCCDTDCSTNDLQVYRCDVKLESVIKTTCFKDLSLYRSNSPYIIRKENGLTCIDQERSVNYTYYQQLIDDKMNSSVFTRSVNTDNSVSLSTSTPINLTQYQVGTSVFRYFRTNNVTSTFSLPISFPNGPLCSSTKTITYLNDFTSTCTQSVNQQTCTNVLNPVNYASDFCLITNPTTLTDSNPTPVCCSATVTASNWVSGTSTCAGALQTLNLIIYYTNPTGIVSCNITWTSNSPTSTSQQTFTVSFIRNGSVSSTVPRSGNPGYLQGAAILAGPISGSTIAVSQFTIPQALSTGLCSTTSTTTIRFGQNIQSTCLFGSTTSLSCPNINSTSNLLMPIDSTTFRVASYGNSDPSDISTHWLPVTYCISETGSTANAVCQQGSIPSTTSDQCYNRLDIQIAYANIGSVDNPQPILGAVIFHYQRITLTNTTTLSAPLLLTRTVTFQDISNVPVTQGDHLPQPNTRLPGDFFYAFFRNHASTSSSLSLIVYLLINLFLMFILM